MVEQAIKKENVFFFTEGKSPQLPKVPRTDNSSNGLQPMMCLWASQKAVTKREKCYLPLTQEFPKLQLTNKGQIRREFPITNHICGTDEVVIPKTPQLSHPGGDLSGTVPEKFKIPETPFIPKPPFIPETPLLCGTPQCDKRSDQKRKLCTMVPETPFLNVSPIPEKNVIQRNPIDFNRKEPVRTKEQHSRPDQKNSLAKKQFVQVVPETPSLKFKSSEELSLYD